MLWCVSGEALLHERGAARHMRRSLTRPVPGAICIRRASVGADYVRLGSVVGRGALATEPFDCVCVANTRRARGEHAGISALGRVADAVCGDVILQITRRAPHQQLNPRWRIATGLIHGKAVFAVGYIPMIEANRFVWNVVSASRLTTRADSYGVGQRDGASGNGNEVQFKSLLAPPQESAHRSCALRPSKGSRSIVTLLHSLPAALNW